MNNERAFTHCVKCATPKAGGIECPKCGVIYEKAETKHRKELEEINKITDEIPTPIYKPAIDDKKLTQCPACSKNVSKNAASCPHCGDPLKNTQLTNKQNQQPAKNKGFADNFKIGCLGFIFISGIFSFFANSYNDKSSKGTPESPKTETVAPKEAVIKKISLKTTWTTVAFDSILETDFTIKNNSANTVKDIEVSCRAYAKSGTFIDNNTRVIYEIFSPGQTKTIEKFNMGFLHNQADKVGCTVTDLKL